MTPCICCQWDFSEPYSIFTLHFGKPTFQLYLLRYVIPNPATIYEIYTPLQELYARSDLTFEQQKEELKRLIEKQHEESKIFGNDLVTLKSEILRLSKYTKDLKEATNNFSSKLVDQ